jgi:hypothetical protein
LSVSARAKLKCFPLTHRDKNDKEIAKMLNKSILLLVALTLSSLALAQRTQEEAAAAPKAAVAPSTTACSFTFSSGSGRTFTQYCVTANGNITEFQNPAGVEYIAVLQVGEGYGICDFASNTSYFDYGYAGSGNWGSTTLVSSTPTQVKFNRLTSDGIWQLTQTITQGKSTAATPGSAVVTMALRNLTGIDRTVWLLRFADVDANSTTKNDFDNTLDVASGLQPGFSYGLMLSSNTFSFSRDAYVTNTFNGPTPCNAFANLVTPGPFVGDGAIQQLYAITVPHGATKAVTMTYKPI